MKTMPVSSARPPDPAAAPAPVLAPGQVRLSRGHRHDPAFSRWRSAVAAIDAQPAGADPTVVRAPGFAALVQWPDAADPADRLPPRASGCTRGRDDRGLRGGGPGCGLANARDLRPRTLEPNDLASLPRRGHAAGGDLRPAPAPPAPGNRPARTAEDTADRPPDRFKALLPCLCRAKRKAPADARVPQAHGPSTDIKAGEALWSCAGTGGSARSWRSVRVHPPAIRCDANRADRRSSAIQGYPAADLHACLPPIPPASANGGSPIAPAAVERVAAKAKRCGIGGMTPGRQPAHRCD